MVKSNRIVSVAAVVATALVLGACQTSPQQQAQQRGQEHLEEGRRYLDQGLSESALAAFSLALQENPRLTEAVFGIGDIYRQRGDYARASESYERATQLEPTSFDAHYYLGLMQQLMGRAQEAVRTYLRALAIKPTSFEANQNLASAYLQLSRAGDALPYAVRAVELNPEAQSAWANLAAAYSVLHRFEEAVDAYRQASELGDPQEPLLLGLADAHLRLGNYERAINVLETLMRMRASATAHERLGYAQFKLLRFQEALASFRSALAIDANDTAALNGLGVCLMTLYIQGERARGDLRDEALAAWRKSIQLRPQQPRILDLIGRYQRL